MLAESLALSLPTRSIPFNDSFSVLYHPSRSVLRECLPSTYGWMVIDGCEMVLVTLCTAGALICIRIRICIRICH